MTKLSEASVKKLHGVHPDLVKLAHRAIEIAPFPFEITEGLRAVERQKQLVADKKSKTMKSKHIPGHAFDFVAKPGGVVSWDMKHYKELVAKAFKPAAAELGLKNIEYGADWGWDGPHVQINA